MILPNKNISAELWLNFCWILIDFVAKLEHFYWTCIEFILLFLADLLCHRWTKTETLLICTSPIFWELSNQELLKSIIACLAILQSYWEYSSCASESESCYSPELLGVLKQWFRIWDRIYSCVLQFSNILGVPAHTLRYFLMKFGCSPWITPVRLRQIY